MSSGNVLGGLFWKRYMIREDAGSGRNQEIVPAICLKLKYKDNILVRKIFSRRVPAQDVHFALILWYVAKIIPTLYKFSLFLSGSSSGYFDGDIMLVHALKGGI